MKLTADPMPALRRQATEQINQAFAHWSSTELHRDQAHARKRTVAQEVEAGGAPPEAFAAEAEMRGMAVVDFARLVLSKPMALDARELERQRMLLAIEAANTPEHLANIVQGKPG